LLDRVISNGSTSHIIWTMESSRPISLPRLKSDAFFGALLRHFPTVDTVSHSRRDYAIAAFTFLCVAISGFFEIQASIQAQLAMGCIAWVILALLLVGENRETQMQVMIAVVFATVGEHFASLYMGGYTYRFENVPAYVPPGHGMVYLTAVALARSGFFIRYAKSIAAFVITAWGTWSLWGISGLPDHGDSVGALLFGIFLVWLVIGRSPLVYLAAFFITTWLELIGTAVGAWHWAAIDPLFGWQQGNPPSGVGAWYCLVDAVAIGGAGPVLRGIKRLTRMCSLSRQQG